MGGAENLFALNFETVHSLKNHTLLLRFILFFVIH